MSEDTDKATIDQYFLMCREDYPDTFRWVGRLPYSVKHTFHALAEAGYYLKHGELPTWAYVFGGARMDNGKPVFEISPFWEDTP